MSFGPCKRVALLTIVLAFAGVALADKKSDLQEKFKKRLDQVNALKTDAKVGETWDGWLAAIKEAKLTEKQQKLVDEENDDRKALYKLIADEEGATTEKVAERNALRHYRTGKKGEWFKLKSGAWKQKEKDPE